MTVYTFSQRCNALRYNPFLVYCRELVPGAVSLTGDWAQGDDSKHDSHYKPQHFFPKCFEKIRQSEVSLGGLLSRPEVRSSLYVNSENATFIQEETFTSYSEYFVDSLR